MSQNGPNPHKLPPQLAVLLFRNAQALCRATEGMPDVHAPPLCRNCFGDLFDYGASLRPHRRSHRHKAFVSAFAGGHTAPGKVGKGADRRFQLVCKWRNRGFGIQT